VASRNNFKTNPIFVTDNTPYLSPLQLNNIPLQLGNTSLATVLPVFGGFIWVNLAFIQYKAQVAHLINPYNGLQERNDVSSLHSTCLDAKFP